MVEEEKQNQDIRIFHNSVSFYIPQRLERERGKLDKLILNFSESVCLFGTGPIENVEESFGPYLASGY